jgi:hypothetical protein
VHNSLTGKASDHGDRDGGRTGPDKCHWLIHLTSASKESRRSFTIRDQLGEFRNVRKGSMLSKKSFLADERNVLAPLVRPTRGNVRDHIESQKNGHRPSHMPCRNLRRPRQLKTDLCEIFGAAQFSTFSTASVKMRKTQREQMFSALRPTADIVSEVVRLRGDAAFQRARVPFGQFPKAICA